MTTPLAFALALPWPLIGFGAWLGYQLVRQHGRLLLRLEALEQGPKALQAQPDRPDGVGDPQRPAAGLQEDPFRLGDRKGQTHPSMNSPDLFGVRDPAQPGHRSFAKGSATAKHHFSTFALT